MANKTPIVKINPDVLSWARKSLNYSEDEAAKKIGVTPEKYTSWESGDNYPTFAQLKKAANVFKRPSAVFFLQESPKEEDSPRDFRLLNEYSVERISPATILSIRSARRKRKVALDISKRIDINFKSIGVKGDLSIKPSDLAKEVREKLGFSINEQYKLREYKFLNYLKSKIEEYGVLIFQGTGADLNEYRGITIHYEQLPIIIINSSDTVNGKLFSLMHEFCHVLLAQSGICNMEVNGENSIEDVMKVEFYCNQFAADFLVPTENFKKEKDSLSGYSTRSLYEALAKKFSVSREVILRKLFSLGEITKTDFFQERSHLIDTYRNISKKSGAVPQSTKAVANNGVLFTKMVIAGFHQNIFNKVNVSDLLQVKGKHIGGIEDIVFKKAF